MSRVSIVFGSGDGSGSRDSFMDGGATDAAPVSAGRGQVRTSVTSVSHAPPTKQKTPKANSDRMLLGSPDEGVLDPHEGEGSVFLESIHVWFLRWLVRTVSGSFEVAMIRPMSKACAARLGLPLAGSDTGSGRFELADGAAHRNFRYAEVGTRWARVRDVPALSRHLRSAVAGG